MIQSIYVSARIPAKGSKAKGDSNGGNKRSHKVYVVCSK
jgi:hypothetical protein